MKLIIPKGSTSNILHIFLKDSSKTDGSGDTNESYSSTHAYYIRSGASSYDSINLVSATIGTYTSGGFVKVNTDNMPGVYEFDPPDACFADGADSVSFYIYADGSMPLFMDIQLATLGSTVTAADMADAVWGAARADHIATATFGEGVNSVQGDLLGSVNALGAQAKTDVNAEVSNVINTYDPPTHDEMITAKDNIIGADGDTLKSLSDQIDPLAIESNIASHVTNSLNAYDPPTKAELNSATGAINENVTDVLKLCGYNVTREGAIITIYEADGKTVWRKYDLSNDGRKLVT